MKNDVRNLLHAEDHRVLSIPTVTLNPTYRLLIHVDHKIYMKYCFPITNISLARTNFYIIMRLDSGGKKPNSGKHFKGVPTLGDILYIIYKQNCIHTFVTLLVVWETLLC